MFNKLKIILFAFFFISHNGFANTPFTANELLTIKRHLFANILSRENTFTKNDKRQRIHSVPGAILASPLSKTSHSNMDYQFHWVRDSAIVMHEVILLYKNATQAEKEHLKSYLLNYIQFENKVQKQLSQNKQHTLGQPIFNIDGTVWEGKWSRPQNDGPALRAINLIALTNIFMHERNQKNIVELLLAMIQIDLNYIVAEWHIDSFDLWEELHDTDHFFNKMVQRKALLGGVLLFARLHKMDLANHYRQCAKQITDSLQLHWNVNRGYFTETLHQQDVKGGGINSAIILGLLYGKMNDDNDLFALDDDKVLSTIYFIENTFKHLYKINLQNTNHFMIGRYASDVYDANQFTYGNPWFLTTASLAQFYYALANVYKHKGIIKINENNILFFKGIDPTLNQFETVYAQIHSQKFNKILNQLVEKGDSLLQTIKDFSHCDTADSCYHLSEQVDRTNGQQVGPIDLTWSYASVLMAMQEKRGVNT